MVADTAIGMLLAAATLLPLAWKWHLGLRRAAVAIVALAIAAGVLTEVADLGSMLDPVPGSVVVWILTVIAAAALVAFRFYRDPERHPPDGADIVVSPADGEVIYVRRAAQGVLPVSTKEGRPYALEELTRTPLASRDAIVVGITLNLLDVHVNRAPIGGRVVSNHHHKGTFRSLARLESLFENERATTVIERDGVQVAVVLIASRLVRRIISFMKEGQEVACGERIGVIRLGSQVDVILPAESVQAVRVDVGDRVRAGESVVAVLGRAPSSEDRTPTSTPAVADRG